MSSTEQDAQLWAFIVHWRLIGIVVIVFLMLSRLFLVWRWRNRYYSPDEMTPEGAFFYWIVLILSLAFLVYSYRNH